MASTLGQDLAPQPDHGRDVSALAVGLAVAGLLAATVLFNPLLAIVNAQVVSLSGGVVAIAQAGLVAGALALGVLGKQKLPLPWLLLTAVLVAANLLLALLRDEFNPKYLADVITITAFICVGTRLDLRRALSAVVILQVLIAAVGVWELLNPESFASVFNPRSYYVNTRGLSDEAFWAGGDLYVSSVRADGRLLLSWTDFHRGSSLFLEPVSLGNWTILVTIVLLTFWRELASYQKALLIVGNVVGLCVCDGRLALVTNLVPVS